MNKFSAKNSTNKIDVFAAFFGSADFPCSRNSICQFETINATKTNWQNELEAYKKFMDNSAKIWCITSDGIYFKSDIINLDEE